ncbi:MAG: glycosyltransferase family 39 protein [Acidobacteriota bacterium]|nr:glycosyltransferase family 39 protein [Acidobacteriota bacterium]
MESSTPTGSGLAAWQHRALIVGLGLLLFLPGLGSRDLWNPDEPRYAEVAREMVASGEFLVPHLNGEIYAQKPPLLFWAIAASGAVLGEIGPAAARLPSALAATATLLLVFELGILLFGLRAAWLAVAVLATAARILWQGRVGQIDMLLVSLVTLAMTCWVRGYLATEDRQRYRWYLGFFAAAGFATLAKGPVGLLPPLLSIVAFLLFTGQRQALRQLRVGRGLLLWLAVVVAWLGPALLAGGGEYAQQILFKQNVTRYVEPWHHHRPWYYYLTALLHDFFPWSLLLPSALVVGWRRFTGERRRWYLFALCWMVVTLVFFSLSPGKRTVYILTMYPAMALLVAAWVDSIAAGESRQRWLTWPLGLLTALLAAVTVLAPGQLPEVEGLSLFDPWVGTVVLVVPAALAVGAGVAWLTCWGRRPAAAVALLATTMASVLATALLLLLPELDRIKSAEPLSRELLAAMEPGDTYAFYPRIDPRFVFYTRRFAEILEDRTQLDAYLAPPPADAGGRWLLVERDDFARLEDLPPLVEVARDGDPKDGYLLLRPAATAGTEIGEEAVEVLAVAEDGDQDSSDREPADRVTELRIQLQRVESLEDAGYVQPGEELILTVGDRLRLTLVAILGERRRAPAAVRAELSVEGNASHEKILRLESVDPEEGSAVLTALRPTGDGEARVRLRYRILDEMNIRGGLVSGTIRVRVLSPRP